MRDVALRQQKERFLEPVAAWAFAAVHPNILSFAALLIGLLAAVAVVQHYYWLGLALWLMNRILDGLDGVVARHYDKQSDFGGYLDLFFDFLVYLAVPISFAVAMPTATTLWTLTALLASYYLNTMTWMGLSTLLEKRQMHVVDRQTSMEMPTGLIEGAETIVLYALFFVAPQYIAIQLGVMAALVTFTACQRLVWTYRHVR